jgi:DNA polymerase-4
VARAIIHVDMDAFYASVEQRDNLSLRGKPVIVGGHPTRGVVLAASYEARCFGIRSAMPMSRAIRQAPQALVVPPHFSAYVKASEQVFAIFGTATPLVESLSLDEAFLDVTASTELLGAPSQIARSIRDRIAKELQLPSSAGVACTKFVAKIACDLAKPNGQHEVAEGETIRFLAALPVSRLWGVGQKTEQTLHSLGLKTIGDVASREPSWLQRHLGSAGEHLWTLSQGIDDRPVVPDREAKSIGSEDTFEEDLEQFEQLRSHIHSQSVRVGRRLRKAELKARVVQLKLKFADFSLLTRQITLHRPTDDGQLLYRAAIGLLERVAPSRPVRLTGVAASGLEGEWAQLPLFGGARTADRLNAALDQIADKFGTGAVRTADLIGEPSAADELREGTGGSRIDLPPREAPR